jgi:hypothetical protein
VGLLIIGLTVLPWHLAQWILHGDSFVRVYFFREVYGPAVSGGDHPLGSLFYLVTLKDGFFPWSILIPASLAWVFSREPKNRVSVNVLLIVWIFGLLSIITLSEIKLFWYILPAYPPLAILVAGLLFSFQRNRENKYLDVSVLISFGLVLTLTTSKDNPFGHLASQSMIQVRFLEGLQSGYRSYGVPVILGLATAATLLVVLWLALAQRARFHSRLKWARALIVACLFGIAIYGAIVPLRFSDHKSTFHQACQEISKLRETHGDLLIALPKGKIREPRHAFYIRQIHPPPRAVTTPRKLVARPRRIKPNRLLLFDRRLFRRIERARPPAWFGDLRLLLENEDYILFEVVGTSS